MTNAVFQEKVLQYSHLPHAFLTELARVADRIPEKQRDEILAELEASAKRELEILAKGYKVISDAEKKVRGEAETYERSQEIQDVDKMLTQSSSFSL